MSFPEPKMGPCCQDLWDTGVGYGDSRGEFQEPLACQADPTPGCPGCPHLQPWTPSQEKGNKFHAPKETPSETWGEKATALLKFYPCRSAGQWGGATGPAPVPLMPPTPGLRGHGLQSKKPPHGAAIAPNQLPGVKVGSRHLDVSQLHPAPCLPRPVFPEVSRALHSSTRVATAHKSSDSKPTAEQTWGLHHRDWVHLSQVVPQDTRLPHQVSWGVSFGRYFPQ